MLTANVLALACVILTALSEGRAQEHPVEGQLLAAEFQRYLWPGHTNADTRLAHSSASSSFRQNRRRLLASSKSSSQATDGAGMIEYRPVGFNIDGDDYASFFAKAHANRRATGIRLSPGTYHVSPSIEEQMHLYMRCATDREELFEIDFTGAFFYFTNYEFGGMKLDNCTNVELHGPYEQTYTNDQLDFAQGKIVEINEDELTYTVEVDDGYPGERVMMKQPIAMSLFYNNTLLIKSPDPYMDVIVGGLDGRKKLGDRKFSFKARGVTPNATVGDYFVARGNTGGVGLLFEKAKNCTARDFTLYHSSGFAVYEPFGRNNTFSDIQIRPFPNPLGRDGKLPLLSSSWDAFHITGAHSGTLIKNNYIVNTGDDAIASSGFYYLVAAVDPGQKTVVIASDREFTFKPDDLLTFYAQDSERLGTVRIVKMYSVEEPKEIKGKTSQVAGAVKFDDADFMKVHLETWPASMSRLQFDDVVSSPSNNGDGFAFVNNTIGNLRGRGILCKSSNGVIAHNRLFNMKGFAIQMSPEYLWVESDFVNNVLVLNNTINTYSPGIWLGVDPTAWRTPALYTNNYNVDFINNTIANSAITPFLLTSSAGISIINTTFINVLCTEKNTRTAWFGDWQVDGAIMMIANVRDITFSGNEVIKDSRCKNPYGNYDHPVAMVNATGVNGLVPRVPADSLLQADSP